MGADMLVAVVAHKAGARPDFEAGHKFLTGLAVEDLDIEELYSQGLDEDGERFDEETGDPILASVIKWLDESLTEFEDNLYGRGVATIQVRDLTLYITGGMSWGDANEEACLFWRLGSVSGLMSAMNFVETWHEVDREVTPEEEAAAIDSIVRTS